MSKPKLTPWFPATQKPVRPGVYEVITRCSEEGQPAYSHFDGAYWNGGWESPERAAIRANFCDKTGSQGSCELLLNWRGLATGATHA
jgi:hypothetical protein